MKTLFGKAILFDMDGTLLDSNEASEMIWQKWAALHQVPIETIRAVHHGRRPEETIALVAPRLNALESSRMVYHEQEKMLAGIHPIAGVTEFYQSLNKNEFAIVTAATLTILTTRLKIVGLTRPEICVTATSVKKGKPDPEGYLQAATRLGIHPKDCIVFEDAPAGLMAAHAAGMQSVAVTTNYTEGALRDELGPDIAPSAFIKNYLGLKFSHGQLSLP